MGDKGNIFIKIKFLKNILLKSSCYILALNTYRTQQAMTLDVLSSLHNSLKSCPGSNILCKDPKELKVELMSHQKYAVSWLMWREKQKPHGGVLGKYWLYNYYKIILLNKNKFTLYFLADDMGLGKTLTMISLILKASENSRDLLEDSNESDTTFDDSPRNSMLLINFILN